MDWLTFTEAEWLSFTEAEWLGLTEEPSTDVVIGCVEALGVYSGGMITGQAGCC